MTAAGRRCLRRGRRRGYSYEVRAAEMDAAAVRVIKKSKKAWEFLERQAPHYRKLVAWWVMSAKKAETKERRLKKLVEWSERGRGCDFRPSGGKMNETSQFFGGPPLPPNLSTISRPSSSDTACFGITKWYAPPLPVMSQALPMSSRSAHERVSRFGRHRARPRSGIR
jgi:hypothetical protein